MSYKILAINPGSTSTKLAIFENESEIWREDISHSTKEIEKFSEIIDQLEWRKELILKRVSENDFDINKFDAVVARGGMLAPIPGGSYNIGEKMVDDLKKAKNGSHASNLAAIIAYEFSQEYNLKAYTVDPVGVDEFEAPARLSGLPEIPRKCQSHALNLKAVARLSAESENYKVNEINQIGVHLGGGISIAAMKKGRIVDVNNANQGGPFSPERVGTLPAIDLVEYIFEKKPKKSEFKKRLLGKGGLAAYLDTNDGREIEKEIKKGNKKAKLVYDAMIYQIAKEISSMAAVLKGEVEAIFITGGLANSDYIVNSLKEMIGFIAEIKLYPGSEEMKHLAEGALRVLNNEEKALDYEKESKKLEKKINVI